MLMHNPPHPGLVIKELCLDPLGISIAEAAKALGISRYTLSNLIHVCRLRLIRLRRVG